MQYPNDLITLFPQQQTTLTHRLNSFIHYLGSSIVSFSYSASGCHPELLLAHVTGYRNAHNYSYNREAGYEDSQHHHLRFEGDSINLLTST